MIKKFLKDSECNIALSDSVVAICVFGSYHSDDWVEGVSDIDIMILYSSPKLYNKDYFSDLNSVEEYCSNYFNYDNIHITAVDNYELNILFAFDNTVDGVIFDYNAFKDYKINRGIYLRSHRDNLFRRIALYEEVEKNGTLQIH